MNNNFFNRLSILTPVMFLLAIFWATIGILFYWSNILAPSFLEGERTKAELVMIYAVDNLEKSLLSGNPQEIEDVMRRLLLLKAPNSTQWLILALKVQPLNSNSLTLYGKKEIEFGGPFSISSPLYSSDTQELLGEVTLQFNSFYYEQLVADAKKNLLWVVGALLCVMIVLQRIMAWLLKPLSKINSVLADINFNKAVEIPTIKGYIVIEIGNVIMAIKDLMHRLEIARQAEQYAKESLIESEGNYRLLVETIPHGIHRVDNIGMFSYANTAICKILGYSKEEIVGKSCFDFVHVNDETEKEEVQKQFFQNLKEQPEPTPYYLSNRKKNGDIIDLQLDWNFEFNEEGEVTGIISIVTDITKRKKAEEELEKHREHLEELVIERTRELRINNEELRKAIALATELKVKAEAANTAKSEFLSNMSHELRTPMHGILSFARLGINKIDSAPKEKLHRYFQQIHNSGNRLMDLLNDLLDLSKLEAGKMVYHMEMHDLKSFVNIIVQEFSSVISEKNLILEVVDPKISTRAAFDTSKISQVIRNLISNAAKFTSEGKKITVCFEDAEIETNERTIPAIKVSVADQGVGIPESELFQVFDKFVQSSKTQTGAGGTGLGLSICHQIITEHGGKIWAENNKDGGAIFSFVLPRVALKTKKVGEILIEKKIISKQQLEEALSDQKK